MLVKFGCMEDQAPLFTYNLYLNLNLIGSRDSCRTAVVESRWIKEGIAEEGNPFNLSRPDPQARPNAELPSGGTRSFFGSSHRAFGDELLGVPQFWTIRICNLIAIIEQLFVISGRD